MEKFIKCEFNSSLSNLVLARGIVASFFIDENINLNIIDEIKTVVSEAVTNAIIHGYDNSEGSVYLTLKLESNILHITVEDFGKGIEDIQKARTILYSTLKKTDRAGIGFTIMEVFSDSLDVISKVNEGTKVTMLKTLS